MGWLLQHGLLPFQHSLCSVLLSLPQVLEYATLSVAWGTALYSYSKGPEFNLDIIFFSKSVPSGLWPLLCSLLAGRYLLLLHNIFVASSCHSQFAFLFSPIDLPRWKRAMSLFSLLVVPSPSRFGHSNICEMSEQLTQWGSKRQGANE